MDKLTERAAVAVDEILLDQWLAEERISVAHGKHMMHLHKLGPESKGTAKKFAELYDATMKARI